MVVMNARIGDREGTAPGVVDARQALREAEAVTSPILVTGGTGTLGRLVVRGCGTPGTTSACSAGTATRAARVSST